MEHRAWALDRALNASTDEPVAPATGRHGCPAAERSNEDVILRLLTSKWPSAEGA